MESRLIAIIAFTVLILGLSGLIASGVVSQAADPNVATPSYIQQMRSAFKEMNAGVLGTLELAHEHSEDYAGWRRDLQVQTDHIRNANDTIWAVSAYSIPSGFTDTHTALAFAARSCTLAADTFEHGYDNGNAGKIEAAHALFEQCRDELIAGAQYLSGETAVETR